MLFGRDGECRMLSSSYSENDHRVSPTWHTSEELSSEAEPRQIRDQCEPMISRHFDLRNSLVADGGNGGTRNCSRTDIDIVIPRLTVRKRHSSS